MTARSMRQMDDSMRSSRGGAAGRGAQYWFPCPRSLRETSIAGLALPHRAGLPLCWTLGLTRPHPPAHPWSVTPQSTTSWCRGPVARSPARSCVRCGADGEEEEAVSEQRGAAQPEARGPRHPQSQHSLQALSHRGPGMQSCSDGGLGAQQGTHGRSAGGGQPTRRGPVPGCTWRNSLGVPQCHSHRDWGTPNRGMSLQAISSEDAPASPGPSEPPPPAPLSTRGLTAPGSRAHCPSWGQGARIGVRFREVRAWRPLSPLARPHPQGEERDRT